MQSFNEVWNIVTDAMKDEFSSSFINLWFGSIKLLYLDEDIAVFGAKNDFYRDIIENKHKDKIAKYLKLTLEYNVDIIIESEERGPVDISKYTSDTYMLSENKPVQPSDINTQVFEHDSVNPQAIDYTFENFIVGSSNKFAHAASQAVADNPTDNEYNPLFIHGESGLGKTHLLYAIMRRIKEKDPSMVIKYVKSEDFTNKLIESIANHTTAEFRNTFRNVNVLMVDDVQFIAGKESTQEEFFHTFNELYEDGKQIILASDRPPSAMKTLETRLKTRFEWGIIADIQPPNLELRVAIMKNKAEKKGIDISYDILNYLAENLTSNVRQLEGAINRICAQSFLINTPITLEMAKNAVSDMITNKPGENISVERILKVVSQRNGVTVEDIKSRKRTETIAFTRHKCVYLIHKLTDMSFGKIGEIFKRDRTTMMNSVKAVEDEIKINSLYEEEINQLIREIKGQN